MATLNTVGPALIDPALVAEPVPGQLAGDNPQADAGFQAALLQFLEAGAASDKQGAAAELIELVQQDLPVEVTGVVDLMQQNLPVEATELVDQVAKNAANLTQSKLTELAATAAALTPEIDPQAPLPSGQAVAEAPVALGADQPQVQPVELEQAALATLAQTVAQQAVDTDPEESKGEPRAVGDQEPQAQVVYSSADQPDIEIAPVQVAAQALVELAPPAADQSAAESQQTLAVQAAASTEKSSSEIQPQIATNNVEQPLKSELVLPVTQQAAAPIQAPETIEAANAQQPIAAQAAAQAAATVLPASHKTTDAQTQNVNKVTNAIGGSQPSLSVTQQASVQNQSPTDSLATQLQTQGQQVTASQSTSPESLAADQVALKSAETSQSMLATPAKEVSVSGTSLSASPSMVPLGQASIQSVINGDANLVLAKSMPTVPPHEARLDSGVVQAEILRMTRQGGGQMVIELTPPDQGRFRLDLRIDTQGVAYLTVEGGSDSTRARLEQGASDLRQQFQDMGLNLQLSMRQESGSFANNSAAKQGNPTLMVGVAGEAAQADLGLTAQKASQTVEQGRISIYA